MAIVKGLSLEAIRSLKGVITFKPNRGRMVAAAFKRKSTVPPTKLKLMYQNRFKVACYYLKTLSQEIRDLWETYTVETDWTWKDAFTSSFIEQWAATNAPPIVVSDLKFSWNGASTQLDLSIADWYYGFDFGYGTDGYGTCPYGTPTALTVNQPHALLTQYELAYRTPTQRPWATG